VAAAEQHAGSPLGSAATPDYIEGELPPRHHDRFAAHEELCPECARLIATLNALLAILPSLRQPPEVAFSIVERSAESVVARLQERT
jgi:hypothetical protein